MWCFSNVVKKIRTETHAWNGTIDSVGMGVARELEGNVNILHFVVNPQAHFHPLDSVVDLLP